MRLGGHIFRHGLGTVFMFKIQCSDYCYYCTLFQKVKNREQWIRIFLESNALKLQRVARPDEKAETRLPYPIWTPVAGVKGGWQGFGDSFETSETIMIAGTAPKQWGRFWGGLFPIKEHFTRKPPQTPPRN
jgi:hypothetical protein